MEAVFWGKFTEVSVVRADHCRDLFSSQTLGELKFFCRGQTLFFEQKCEEESVGQAGGQAILHVQLQYLFFLI